jgi:ribonuclease Y
MEISSFDYSKLFLFLIGSVVLGIPLGFGIYKFYFYSLVKQAHIEADEILEEIHDKIELALLDEKERVQEIETTLWMKVEPDMLKLEERIEDLEAINSEKKSKAEALYKEEQKKSSLRDLEIRKQEEIVLEKENAFKQKKADSSELNQNFILKLAEKSQTTIQDVKKEIQDKLIAEANENATKLSEAYALEIKETAEIKAKALLDVAYDRFARPFCSERGIGAVSFPDENVKKSFNKPENIEALEKITGCDIMVEEDMETVGVAGFDPVRRELTRRALEKIFKEKKQLTPDLIQRTTEQVKKDLLRQIKQDGDQIAKELKLENLHPEIRQMMGSLRYRYSFTQNQYFHCAEVGWLAGLLASELNLEIKKARRVGMLHDLGKAMDHAMDGGHAMIGADFIKAHGEPEDVVHAVRSHHYDETPSTDYAFLVIAADAISGARPGARRSTIESYNQKVTELENIAKSFNGVTDCYILNGGRECRVITNGKVCSDVQCLELSAQIAKRIEAECNYPGQIKVVVVREMIIAESTRAHG